jgi:transposase
MMVKVLVYVYATGTFRLHKNARNRHGDVAFRVLAAKKFPAHHTIREFQVLDLDDLTELFTHVARQARDMGLLKAHTIAVEGTKIKTRASKRSATWVAQSRPRDVSATPWRVRVKSG